MLSLDLIKDTRALIQPYIVNPPLDKSVYLSDEHRNVYIKNDGLQYTKAFKIRGALSKMLRLTDEEKERGVVAISSGNHGIAVSYAAQLLGIKKALIFVPKNTPVAKTERIQYFGAELVIDGKNYDEAHTIGMKYVEENQMVYIDSYDKDPLVYAGQGTLGLEILEQNPNVTSVLVPIGGGGLVTGIRQALPKHIKVIGVQTAACPAMRACIDDQKLYDKYPSEESVCEALIGGIGELAFEYKDDLDDVLLVTEEEIIKGIHHMVFKEKIISEPSSATVIAALKAYPDYDFGNEVVCILSGSNIDEDLLHSIL